MQTRYEQKLDQWKVAEGFNTAHLGLILVTEFQKKWTMQSIPALTELINWKNKSKASLETDVHVLVACITSQSKAVSTALSGHWTMKR
jgi:hypothetical protein